MKLDLSRKNDGLQNLEVFQAMLGGDWPYLGQRLQQPRRATLGNAPADLWQLWH